MIPDDAQQSIEQAFFVSWDWAEKSYHTLPERGMFEYLKPIRNLITDMRARGYDKQYRAGHSLGRFILSRAKEHGLRGGQAHLDIDMNLDGSMTVRYIEYIEDSFVETQLEIERAELTPELEELLGRLLKQPIT